MTQSFFRTTILVAAALAVGGGAAWAQTAPQSQTRAGEPATDAGIRDHASSDSDRPVADTWITTKVKTELAVTDGVKSMDISVKTVNGVVTLTGTQPSETAVKKAESVAQSIKGVSDVDVSGLKVDAENASEDETDESSSAGDAVNDGWITTKVKVELASTDGIQSGDVSVKTTDGVVALTGVLESDEAVKKAEAAAQSVKGVKEVDSSGLKTKG